MKHIVYFENWCEKCQYAELEESEDPCNECLNESMNEDSRKPVNWQEAE